MEALMILKDGTANSSSSNSITSTHALTVLPFGEIYLYSWLRGGETVREGCWTRWPSFNATPGKELLAVDRGESLAMNDWSRSWVVGKEEDELGLRSVS